MITIDFEIDIPRNVSMHLFDVRGRKIRTIFEDRTFQPGHFQEKWHGKNDRGLRVSNGVYMVQFISDNKRLERKITFIK